jgi:hypothetical protein
MERIRESLQLNDINASNAVCSAVLELSFGWNSVDSKNQDYIQKDVNKVIQTLGAKLVTIQNQLGDL